MAGVPTETTIANLALLEISEPPTIGDLAENTPAAVACRTTLDAARDATLRKKWWNFATAWKTLTAITGAAEGPLPYRHALPEDCVLVRFVDGLGTDQWEVQSAILQDPIGATVEQNYLATVSATAPLICYTRRVTAFRIWDAQSIVAMAKVWGSMIAPILSRDADRARELRSEAKEDIEQAGKTDAREKARSEVSRETSFVTARRIGGYRG
jgi:hypothetical protein